MLTGFTLPKLLWVRDNEPRNFERVRKMLLPKDYIRFQLTGDFASDVSDASGTALFDVVKRRWSFEMMDALALDRGILARVYESSEVTGQVTEEAARDTGLAPGTPVVGGGGDQASSAVGNGIVSRAWSPARSEHRASSSPIATSRNTIQPAGCILSATR